MKIEIDGAFMTGSRVYGKPDMDSDWDMVLMANDSIIEELIDACDGDEEYEFDEEGEVSYSIRFGNLNLIVLQKNQFKAWKDATEELIQRKPVTRDQAVECIQQHLALIDIPSVDPV